MMKITLCEFCIVYLLMLPEEYKICRLTYFTQQDRTQSRIKQTSDTDNSR